jgi:hypothetical protein
MRKWRDEPVADAPFIAAAAASQKRPLWSVMIPVYNCADYLRETLASVLCQDPGPDEMEIVVIDNCSTKDDPEAVVRELGKGRVAFIRQATNVGAIENFNSCIRQAKGEWVHILHGDDTVRPGFYKRAREIQGEHSKIGAIAFRILYVAGDGTWLNLADLEEPRPSILGEQFLARQFVNQKFQFSGIIVRRAVYEELGGFRPELMHCTDWDMWNRIALHKPIFYDPEPLACFRQHDGSDSSAMFKTGKNVEDERRSIQFCCSYVAASAAPQLYKSAMEQAAVRACRRARKFWAAKQYKAAFAQAKEALRTSLAPSVILRLVYFSSLAAAEYLSPSSPPSQAVYRSRQQGMRRDQSRQRAAGSGMPKVFDEKGDLLDEAR